MVETFLINCLCHVIFLQLSNSKIYFFSKSKLVNKGLVRDFWSHQMS